MDAHERVATYNAALTDAQAERWREAAQKLESLVSSEPADTRALNLLGKVYFHRGQPREAEECWRYVLKHAPDDLTARACLDALDLRAPLARPAIWFAGLVIMFAIQIGLLWYVRDLRHEIAGLHSEIESATRPETQTIPAPADDKPSDAAEEKQAADNLEISIGRKEEVQKGSPPLLNASTASPDQVAAASEHLPPPTLPAEQLYSQAIGSYQRGDVTGAESTLRQLVERSDLPADLQDNLVFWLGACALAQGRRAEARKLMAQLLLEYPATNKREDAQRLLKRVGK